MLRGKDELEETADGAAEEVEEAEPAAADATAMKAGWSKKQVLQNLFVALARRMRRIARLSNLRHVLQVKYLQNVMGMLPAMGMLIEASCPNPASHDSGFLGQEVAGHE